MPVRRTIQHPFLLWVVVAGALGALLGYAESSHRSLDDRDLAYQRPGFLLRPAQSPLEHSFADLVSGAPASPPRAMTSLVVFLRPELPVSSDTLRDLEAGSLPAGLAAVAAVAPASLSPATGIPLVVDQERRIADAYGMRPPADGGYPIGYAIVDAGYRVRYSTLDPNMPRHWDEIATMLRAAS